MNGLSNRNGSVNGNGPQPGYGAVKWNGNGSSKGNGLTGGRGLINGNGLVNGNGFVNGAGRGLTGGSGLINGNGLINGCQKPDTGEAQVSRGGSGWRTSASLKKVRLGVMIVIASALVITVPMLAMLTVTPAERMAIDGDFSDWNGATVLFDGPDASIPSPDQDIERYSTAVSGSDVFFFVQVAGKMMAGKVNGVYVVNVFIDSDLDDSTG